MLKVLYGLRMDKEVYTDRINTFIKKGNYHAAINVALSALNACHKDNDQQGVDDFLDIIKEIIRHLGEEFGSQAWLASQ